ncbi:MAG: hypothetical protein JSS43_16085 [Proteobacteria bacterium]|nr:hypothetical protein [Pseudomonadota bacterium]
MTDHELRAISKRLKPGAGGRGRHSTLYRWLYEHADGFQRLLNDSSPSWDSVADAMTTHGLTDGAGKPPTAERARKTWFEVRRAKGWMVAAPLPPAPTATPAPVRPIPPPLAPPSLPNLLAGLGDEDDDFEFRTLRSTTPRTP